MSSLETNKQQNIELSKVINERFCYVFLLFCISIEGYKACAWLVKVYSAVFLLLKKQRFKVGRGTKLFKHFVKVYSVVFFIAQETTFQGKQRNRLI